METTVYNQQGQESGKINLPGVFETKISPALMHEVMVGYLANQRQGTHKTKTRGEVSGGSKKPWKQKGTGNARAGSIRSPLWRKGGIIFGPKPRDYSQNMPQQKRRQSLNMALTSKAQDGSLLVVDTINLGEAKTKKVAEIMKNLKVADSTILLCVDKADAVLKRASRNVPGLVMVEVNTLNAYQVMWAQKVIFTSAAIAQLNK